MRRIWGKAKDRVMDYVCCEPDDTWYYQEVPITEGKVLSFDLTSAKLVPRNSAIRKVKMWGFPLSDEEKEEIEVHKGEASVEVEVVREEEAGVKEDS